MRACQTALYSLLFALLFVDAGYAQAAKTCRGESSRFDLGTVVIRRVFWPAGITCSVPIRIGSNYEKVGASIAVQGKLGRAGVSVDKSRQADGRTVFVVAYQGKSPGIDRVEVKIQSTDIATKVLKITTLVYEISVE